MLRLRFTICFSALLMAITMTTAACGDSDTDAGDEPASITGYLHIDDSGVRLCGVQLESFPVQCGDELATVVGIDLASIGDFVDLNAVRVTTEQGVTWTDSPVTLTGTLAGGVLTVD
jgi:hypothetical protein